MSLSLSLTNIFSLIHTLSLILTHSPSLSLSLILSLSGTISECDESLDEIKSKLIVTEPPVGSTIYENGEIADSMFFLTKGQVKLYIKNEDGSEAVKILEAGNNIFYIFSVISFIYFPLIISYISFPLKISFISFPSIISFLSFSVNNR